VPLVLPRERAANDYITPLWAARRAGALTREIRLRGPSPELMDALRQLALRHGILTEYTAYLVQEPDVLARAEAERRVMAQSSRPPSDQAGAAAVARSSRERDLADVRALDEVAEAGRKAAPTTPTAGPGGATTRRVGGRLFVQGDAGWTDAGHDDRHRLVVVEPFSDAYFAVLAALPELRGPAALQPAVVVAGARVSIKIAAGGERQWRPGELAGLVRDFRS
jgi:Ca-activated chloride channel family protein